MLDQGFDRPDGPMTDFLAQDDNEINLAALSGFPPMLNHSWQLAALLPYGENSHQQAALYGDFYKCFAVLQGKQLNYAQILSVSTAVYLIGEFEKATVAAFKHTYPYFVTCADTLVKAWTPINDIADAKHDLDDVVIVNRTVDDTLAYWLTSLAEGGVVVAPGYTPEAQAELGKRLTLVAAQGFLGADTLQEMHTVPGGVVVQDRDHKRANGLKFTVVTARQPTAREWEALSFAWRVVKHAKSTAVVFAQGESMLGIGAGQMSISDGINFALMKAQLTGRSLTETVLATDTALTTPEEVSQIAATGAKAIIQPGESREKAAIIATANDHGLAMVFTGQSHFKH